MERKAIRVVIVGGGFAAVTIAKTLRSKLRASQCQILLFSNENHMVFHPLLADVAGASINADAAAAPLRQMLPGVGCRTERVQRIDLVGSEIEFEVGNGTADRKNWGCRGCSFPGHELTPQCGSARREAPFA